MYKTLLSIILSIRWAYSSIYRASYSRSRSQGKVKLRIWRLGGVIHVFGPVFRQERDKWPWDTFWTAQIGQTLEIGKIQKSQGRWRKWPFSSFKIPKLDDSSRYLLEISCKHTHLTSFFSHTCRFFLICNSVENTISYRLFFKTVKIFKFRKFNMAVW